MGSHFLTVAIQTYNRGPKVERLVNKFIDLIRSENVEDQVEIHVSDNASPDDTEARLRSLATEHPVRVRYTRQEQNLQFDGNTAFLYESTQTPYMWLFGDDDVPLPGALTRILSALMANTPDVLLFSFNQPPDRECRQFDFHEAVHLTHEPADCISLIMRYTKISIFVYRRCSLSDTMHAALDAYSSSGWYYIGLAFSVLGDSPTPTVAVISEALAAADKDFARLAYTPEGILGFSRAVTHPYVESHAPGLPQEYEIHGYCTAIAWCLSERIGTISSEDPEAYRRFVRSLPVRWQILLSRPKTFIQFIALRFGLWRLWVLKRKMMTAKQEFPS